MLYVYAMQILYITINHCNQSSKLENSIEKAGTYEKRDVKIESNTIANPADSYSSAALPPGHVHCSGPP